MHLFRFLQETGLCRMKFKLELKFNMKNSGKGKVIKVEGENPNEKATVFFPSEGQKQLLLKFAKLKIVGA